MRVEEQARIKEEKEEELRALRLKEKQLKEEEKLER